MNYPLLSEYVESIRSAEDNLAELNHLHPVLDASGDPVMTGGNFAVVFKMQDKNTGKYYALKCFTREQEGRAESYKLIAEELEFVNTAYFTHFKYYDKELFVDCANSDETEFPVVLMDWVEGLTLDKYVIRNKYDGYKLSSLTYNFYKFSDWLLSQPFAHGDLKPDNILVSSKGNLILVDYDGMFVPKMLGQSAREQGSPNYRIPYPINVSFNKSIDDFAITHILLSLRVYSLYPYMIQENRDFALFNHEEFSNISTSSTYQEILSSNIDVNTSVLLLLFQKCLLKKMIEKSDWELLDFTETNKTFANFADLICDLNNIVLAVDLAYSSMRFKDPARDEYSLNNYRKKSDRILLATEIQENLKNRAWPYSFGGIKYSRLKTNGIEKREGLVLDLDEYALKYLFALAKYTSIQEAPPQNIFGGGVDVFTENCDENKYESYLEEFVKTQEICASKYKYLYVFDIRNFFQNVSLHKLKDLFFDNSFKNVGWYEKLFCEVLSKTSVKGLNPCSEVDFFLANLYLKPLDNVLNKIEGTMYYRYCDDIRLFANDNTLLDFLRITINSALSPLSLNINDEKTKLIDTSKDKLKLAKACFVWSGKMCYKEGENSYLLNAKSLSLILNNDLTISYMYKLLKAVNVEADEYNGSLDQHFKNLFYVLKNVHNNFNIYRIVLELLFDRGLYYSQSFVVLPYVLEKIYGILNDVTVEPFIKYWILRTFFCSEKEYYKLYFQKEKELVGQPCNPMPGYISKILSLITNEFRKKTSDKLLFHISDYIISIIEPDNYYKDQVADSLPFYKDELPF